LPISIDGGSEPAWSRDGNELFYRHGDSLMKVSIRYSPRFEAGRPEPAIDEPSFRHPEGTPPTTSGPMARASSC
jgi:hypothetical protein